MGQFGRWLGPERQRPRRGGAADKCDEFPSPHGITRAKDYIGYEKNITFFDRDLRSSFTMLLHCDYVVASSAATFATPFTNHVVKSRTLGERTGLRLQMERQCRCHLRAA